MRLLLPIFLFPLLLSAQVANDDIHEAITLESGKPVSSSTAYCTIQPECVNYALTKSCIKYHNDQWFVFNSGKNSHLFINVAQQACRDLLGVQLVVLKGQPCKVEDYELLECISLGSNDDFYVKVDSLHPNTEYLLNIDGLLHDFCSFDIIVDTIPLGMPNELNLELESQSRQDSSLVQFSWVLADSIENEIHHFEIWRRHEDNFKHGLRQKIAVSRNAYGSIEKQYSFADTIGENSNFNYRLLAVNMEGRKFLFKEGQFKGVAPVILDAIKIRLMYPIGTPLSITIYDNATGEIFRKVRFSFDPQKHDVLEYPISYLIHKGVENIIVEVVNNKTNQVYKRVYRLR